MGGGGVFLILKEISFFFKPKINVLYRTSSSKSKVWSAYPYQYIMVSMLDSLVDYREFEPQSGQTKYNKSDVHCFSAMYLAFRRKRKDSLT